MADNDVGKGVASISELLTRLTRSAEVLERESQTLGSVLDGIEKKLQGLDLDLDAWVESTPLATHELSVSASNVAPRVEDQLGFSVARGAGPRRRLCVRSAEYVPDSATVSGEYRLARVIELKLLSAASREQQMVALPLLPVLLEQLADVVEKRTESIRQARGLAEG